MNMIQEDPVNPNVLYTCNDFGVYVSTNGGQHWEVLGGNLPSVKSWTSSSIRAITCSSPPRTAAACG